MQPKPHCSSIREYVQFMSLLADPATLWALEPWLDCPSQVLCKPQNVWPPQQQIFSVDYSVHMSNWTDSPIPLKSGEQLCQVRHILPIDVSASTAPTTTHNAVSPSLAT